MNRVVPARIERALAVGLSHDVVARAVPGVAVVLTRFAALSDALLQQTLPDAIVFPLFGDGFDGVQVAERLSAAGFRGTLLVVTAPLPAPGMVLQELRAAYRLGEVQLIELL